MDLSSISKWFSAEAAKTQSSYNYALGWSSTSQPAANQIPNLITTEYLELAEVGVPVLRAKFLEFCQRSNLTVIEIPHEDYREGFERGNLPFRPWLNAYCAEKGLNPNANIAMVGPCVKDEGSSEFKEKTRTADRVRDYLRVMGIFLEGPTRKTSIQSLDNMGDAFVAMETDEMVPSVARKNYMHTPKSSGGFRAYKSAWVIGLAEPYDEFEMLAEVKFEHEKQQDLNRMTRRFMTIKRHAQDHMATYYPTCTSSNEKHFGTAASNLQRIQRRATDLDNFAKAAYDQGHHQSGLNRFLNPEIAHLYAPLPQKEMDAVARKAIESYGLLVAREMANAGLKIPKVPGMDMPQEFTHA